MKYVLFAILAYIAFQVIFKLVIPVYKATRNIKKGFREMQEKMQDQQATQTTAGPDHTHTPQEKPKVKAGDYIEFEELANRN